MPAQAAKGDLTDFVAKTRSIRSKSWRVVGYWCVAKHHLPVFAGEHIPMASAGCGGNGWTDHDVAEAALPRIRAGSKRVAQAQVINRITENFRFGLRIAADSWRRLIYVCRAWANCGLIARSSKAAVCGRAFTNFRRSCPLQLLLQSASYCLVVAAVGFTQSGYLCSDVATSEHQIQCHPASTTGYPCR